MTDSPLVLAERAVPRYTSYPTAPHFSPDVGPDLYAQWLEALPQSASLSLYLHVPFCSHMCWYCGCHTKVVRRRDPIEQYAARLLQEIDLLAARAGGRRVVHIHWGGGTPSMLGADNLRAVADKLRARFGIDAHTEHAIELDPRQVDAKLVAALQAMGVTRASLGVQDFSPHVQEASGRVQPYEVVAKTVAMLREAGIAALNIDLMYGLPKQTEADVRRTVELTDSLRPNRLALFGYAHVPWFKTHQKLIDEAALPGTSARLAQALAAQEALRARGYEAIGLDHFAKPEDALAAAARRGELHRNFQGYTTDKADALLGIGVSSIGSLPQGFAQNAPDIASWNRAIDAGRFATARGIATTAEDRLRARVIERLMCDFAVDLDAVSRGGDGVAATFAEAFETLEPLAAQGLVRVSGHRVEITEAGRPFVRLAAAAFDTYLAKGKARHSVAV